MATPIQADDLPASAWIARFAPLVPAGPVLDLAAGRGRHSVLMRGLGHEVVAVDRDPSALAARALPGIAAVAEDLEAGATPACLARRYAGVVVTNYLHRPLFDAIRACLQPGGMLVYETFMAGNERFGKPSNPRFLLAPGELWQAFGDWRVLGFAQGFVADPKPAMIQRLVAVAGAFPR